MNKETRHEELIVRVGKLPNALCNAKGEVLMSGLSSLARGDFYILGLNPGQPDSNGKSVVDHVQGWHFENFSAYVDQCWRPSCWRVDSFGRQKGLTCDHRMERQRSRFQSRVIELMSAVGIPEDQLHKVCSTNAVFAASERGHKLKKWTGLDLSQAWEKCWPVHKWLLEEVIQPRVVLCLGYGDVESPYAFMRQAMQVSRSKEVKKAGLKWFDATFRVHRGGFSSRVIGVLHPSCWFRRKEAAAPNDFAEIARAAPGAIVRA
jgi:hypothetical protein